MQISLYVMSHELHLSKKKLCNCVSFWIWTFFFQFVVATTAFGCVIKNITPHGMAVIKLGCIIDYKLRLCVLLDSDYEMDWNYVLWVVQICNWILFCLSQNNKKIMCQATISCLLVLSSNAMVAGNLCFYLPFQLKVTRAC